MKSCWHYWVCAILVSSVLGVGDGRCADPNPAGLIPQLESVLKSESQGSSVDRRQLLTDFADSVHARWHAGFMLDNNQWLSCEDLEKRTSDKLVAYRSKREELQSNPDRHRIMARWCELHELPELARPHHFGVLHQYPDDTNSRSAIGHVWCLDRWYSPEDVTEARSNSRKLVAQLDKWLPIVCKIAPNLVSAKSKVKLASVEALQKINDQEAIPALELLALNARGDVPRFVVAAIAKFRSREACHALARIALCDPDPETYQASVTELRTYPAEMFVPELLQMLSSTAIQSELVAAPNGKLALVTLIAREMMDEVHVQSLRKVVNLLSQIRIATSAEIDGKRIVHVENYRVLFPFRWREIKELGPTDMVSTETRASASQALVGQYVPRLLAVSTKRSLMDDRASTLASAHRLQLIQDEGNGVICKLLRAVTDETLDDSPSQWWKWWIDYNERYAPGMKPTSLHGYNQFHDVSVQTQYLTRSRATSPYVSRATIPTFMGVSYSCLVSGTLVQTSTGLTPIEKIQIGDQVLSQNVETGELALKARPFNMFENLLNPCGTWKFHGFVEIDSYVREDKSGSVFGEVSVGGYDSMHYWGCD